MRRGRTERERRSLRLQQMSEGCRVYESAFPPAAPETRCLRRQRPPAAAPPGACPGWRSGPRRPCLPHLPRRRGPGVRPRVVRTDARRFRLAEKRSVSKGQQLRLPGVCPGASGRPLSAGSHRPSLSESSKRYWVLAVGWLDCVGWGLRALEETWTLPTTGVHSPSAYVVLVSRWKGESLSRSPHLPKNGRVSLAASSARASRGDSEHTLGEALRHNPF
ncbi:unnamed protein product [Coccothraustes coccothraustes]